jgi:hypothetical protein
MIKIIFNQSTNIVEVQYRSNTFDTWVQDKVFTSCTLIENTNCYDVNDALSPTIKAKYPINLTIVEYL